MPFKKWLVHAVAYCRGCDWRDESYQTSQRAAARHHKKTGHEVHIETGYSGEYK